MHKPRHKKDGAFVAAEDDKHRLLTVRHGYGDKKIYFPGGGKERGESPSVTGANEFTEETGLYVARENLQLLAILGQLRGVWNGKPFAIDGDLFFYRAQRYEGELSTDVDDEITERTFRSVREIVKLFDAGEVARSTVRMALIYDAFRRGILPKLPYEAMLGDPFPVGATRFI